MSLNVYLHGALARFGPVIPLHVRDPASAISALAAQLDGFAACLRRGRYRLEVERGHATGGSSRRRLGGDELDLPLSRQDHALHLSPWVAGSGRDDGKMLLGLTLLGLSFVPGVQAGITSGLSGLGESLAGAGGAELGSFLGSRLLGGAGAWLLLSGASEALSPQVRRPAGDAASRGISALPPVGEGAAVPMVYGTVQMDSPPVISAGLSVRTMRP